MGLGEEGGGGREILVLMMSVKRWAVYFAVWGRACFCARAPDLLICLCA